MSLPSVDKPLPDLDENYVVQPSDWNSMFDTLYNYLNSTVKDAIEALQDAPAPTVAAQGTFQARLTLQSGVAVPSVPQSAKPTLYLTNRGGNLIGQYDTANLDWVNRAFSVDLSLACPAGTRDLFDIWTWWNGSGLVLTATGYATQACTNNPAAGTNVTCNMASTANFAVGDIVSITDGSNQEEARVAIVNAGVSIVLDNLLASYTTPTIRSNTPLEPITFQDGIPVRASDKSFRFAGTVMVIANALNDTLSLRCIGNYYNRVERPFYHANNTNYTQATGLNLANSIKTIGTAQTVFVTPQGNMSTTYRLNRSIGYSNRNLEILEQIDGVMASSGGYINTTGATGLPGNLSLTGAVQGGGRHTILDWVNVPSGTASLTMVADTYQVSATSGTILN